MAITTFVFSVTSEVQENANATGWVKENSARRKLLPSSSRMKGALAGKGAESTLVIVGHGSPTHIGTAQEGTDFTPNDIAGVIVRMTPGNNINIYFACCETTDFATAVGEALLASKITATCIGQDGDFLFPSDMPNEL